MKKFEFKLTIFEGEDLFWQGNPSPQDLYEILDDCLKEYGFKEDFTLFELIGYKNKPRDLHWD